MKKFFDEVLGAVVLAAAIGIPFALYFVFVMKP